MRIVKQMVEERVMREAEFMSEADLGRKYGKSRREMREYFQDRGMKKPRMKPEIARLRLEIPNDELLGLLLEKNIEELCLHYNSSLGSMKRRIKEVTGNHRKPEKHDVTISREELIEASGLFTLKEMAELYGCGRRTICKKLSEYGIEKPVVIPLIRDRESKSSLENVLPVVYSAIDYSISQRPEAEKMAAGYILSNNNPMDENKFNNRLLRLCKSYLHSKKKGERVSISKLSRRSGFHTNQIYRIGKKLGWNLRVKGHTRGTARNGQDLRIAETYHNSVLSTGDIAGFLEVSTRPIENIQNEFGVERIRKVPLPVGGRKKLSYYDASRVYECQDVGFSFDETMEYTGLDEDKVSRALKLRSEIEPRIVKGLRILTGRKVERPYLL